MTTPTPTTDHDARLLIVALDWLSSVEGDGSVVAAWIAERLRGQGAAVHAAVEEAEARVRREEVKPLVMSCRGLIAAIEALAVESHGGPPVNWEAIDATQDAARAAIRTRNVVERAIPIPITDRPDQPQNPHDSEMEAWRDDEEPQYDPGT